MNVGAQQLDGLWQCVAYEVDGVPNSPEALARMAKLVFLVGDYREGWEGLWAVVTSGFKGGVWSEHELRSSSRHTILGGESEGIAPADDFYYYAGGRLRLASDKSPGEIDLVQFWHGDPLPSTTLGLYFWSEERLRICMAENGSPRPTEFKSGERGALTLEEWIRI
jgi:uncharacterized protein (TIGR03067 family)